MGLKLFNRSIALLTSGVVGYSLCGCSRRESINNDSITTSVSSTMTSTTSTSVVSTTVLTEVVTEPIVVDNISSYDEVVLSHFENIGTDISDSIDSSDFLEKGKKYFIYCVDFLFFNGEINGLRFSDLSEKAKQQLLNDIIFVDDLICSKFPTYKENISEGSSKAYDKASEIIRSGSTNMSDYSREKLGEDNYNKIKEYKDLFVEQTGQDWEQFKDIVGSGYDKGKAKVKDWYENYKKGQ